MPAPQIRSGIQPRVFEIAACGGFQIIDRRDDLFEIFNEDEIVTFDSIPDLIDKVKYYTKYPDERLKFINAGLKVVNRNTWKDRATIILANV